jgi:5-methylcytosine-specific restriction enzyme B
MTARSEITARMIFAGAQILADHPDGLTARLTWAQILQRLPNVEQEWGAAGTGKTRASENFSWYRIDLVKAGWATRSGLIWQLTPVGRKALSDYSDAETFFRAARSLYADWDRNKHQFELATRLVEAIPEGNWIEARELAMLTGLEQARLVQWLQGDRPDGWYRVLDADGRLPADVPMNETEAAEWQRLLEGDGIDVVLGHANSAHRLPVADLAEVASEEIGGGEEVVRRAWLVRGSNVQGVNLVRDLWLKQGVCSLPATRLRSLPAGTSREQVKAAVDEDYAHASIHDRARQTAEYHSFLSRMRDGDIIMTNDGSVIYLGVLTGGPAFVTSVGSRANLQRTVDWRNVGRSLDYTDDLPDEISARLSNPDADLIELTEFIADLERLLGEEPDSAPPLRELRLPDVTEEFAAELLIDRDWLQECVELLRDKPQLIFYGPPGTGKTYLAQELARYLTGGKPENVQLVQFHPAYSYEDFFEGFRPSKNAAGAVTFELSAGPLRRLADAARTHPDEPHVLIVDEINRGNLAKVFGELYFLLEYRRRAVNLLYGSDDGQGFSLPRNLFILATMNSADRSIALVDTAMRRRFAFCELHPDEPPTRDLLAEWLSREEYPDDAALLLTELNARIEDRDFRIGPSYLMNPAAQSAAGLQRIWRTQLIPLLEEHHYGDLTRAQIGDRYGLAALRRHLGLPEPGSGQPSVADAAE